MKDINLKKLALVAVVILVLGFVLTSVLPLFGNELAPVDRPPRVSPVYEYGEVASQEAPAIGILSQQGAVSGALQGVSSAVQGSSSASSGSTVSFDSGGLKIIYTANFQIEVYNYSASFGKISAIATAKGGFISNSQSTVSRDGRTNGFVTIRIPARRFHDVLFEIESLGLVKSRQVGGQDVTGQYTDVQARLNNAVKQEQRLLEILEKAQNVTEILMVEEQLDRIREKIEVYTAQIRSLDDLVDQATVTVNLQEPEAIVGSSSAWDEVVETVKTSVNVFFAGIKGMILLAARWLPFIILLAVLYFAFKEKLNTLWPSLKK